MRPNYLYLCLSSVKNSLCMQRFVLFVFLVLTSTVLGVSQPTPAPAQTQAILIMNATAHIGNGTVIANSLIGIEGGKIVLVADATVAKIDVAKYPIVIQAAGKHVYPGFIAPLTSLGLVEISAVRSTNDVAETGEMNPHVRSLIAYNTDSRVIPTVRSNGVLLAQITPEGGTISGQSSVVQLDAWNWEDAAYRTDDGIHLNWPNPYSGRGSAPKRNEDYPKQVEDLKRYFAEAKAYCAKTSVESKNLRFEAMRGLFDGTKTLYVGVNRARPITEAVMFAKQAGLHIVITGGYDAWQVADLLKAEKVSVILQQTQSLPNGDDADISQSYKNPGLLFKAGVPFASSINGSWQLHNLAFQAGQAVGYGLPYEEAVRSLTLATAIILGIDKTVGSLEIGKDATLFISIGDALDMRTCVIERAFIQGRDISLDNKQKELYRKYKAKYGSAPK